jgi:probable F420-dependent oxidoreductase
VRFGLALPHYDFSLGTTGVTGERASVRWQLVHDWARRAENLGFDSVWVSDHLFLDLGKYGGPADVQGSMECFTTLAALAATTERVRLGSLVACNDLRSPAIVAKMAATLDIVSGGRIDVGMGAGWYEPEYRAAGVSFDPPGVRVGRLAEAVQVVGGMLSSAPFSFEGSHYRVEEAWNLPRPVQSPRPPVWVGGKGDRVAALAGRHADGFNCCWAWTPQAYAGRMEIVDRAARKAGRNPSDVRRSVGLYTLPGTDEDDVRRRWERYLANTPPGIGASLTLEVWRRDKLCGPPDALAETIEAFAALGVEEIILSFGVVPFQVADPSAPDLFAAQMFPKFSRLP